MEIPGNSRKGNFSKASIKKAIPDKEISGNYMELNSRNGYYRHCKAKQFQTWQLQTIPDKAIPRYSRQGNFRQFQAKRFDIRKFQTIPGKKF